MTRATGYDRIPLDEIEYVYWSNAYGVNLRYPIRERLRGKSLPFIERQLMPSQRTIYKKAYGLARSKYFIARSVVQLLGEEYTEAIHAAYSSYDMSFHPFIVTKSFSYVERYRLLLRVTDGGRERVVHRLLIRRKKQDWRDTDFIRKWETPYWKGSK